MTSYDYSNSWLRVGSFSLFHSLSLMLIKYNNVFHKILLAWVCVFDGDFYKCWKKLYYQLKWKNISIAKWRFMPYVLWEGDPKFGSKQHKNTFITSFVLGTEIPGFDYLRHDCGAYAARQKAASPFIALWTDHLNCILYWTGSQRCSAELE